jgi:hypothetical protein
MIVLAVGAVYTATRLSGEQESSGSRRPDINTLSAAEKDQLLSRQERFEKFSPSEKERLRQLAQQLASDPQSERLQEVMSRYHSWLNNSLSTTERLEVVSLPRDQRIRRIKQILEEQEAKRREDLARHSVSFEDLMVVRSWMMNFVQRDESKLLAAIPPERLTTLMNSRWNNHQFRYPMLLAENIRIQKLENDPTRYHKLLGITNEDREQLVSRLSATPQETYRRQQNDSEQLALTENWIRAAVMPTWGMPTPSREDLRRIWEKLDQATRDQLDYLHPELRDTELLKMYKKEKMFGRGKRGGGDDRRRGGEPYRE